MRGKINLLRINVFTFVILFLSAIAISIPLSKDDDCFIPDLVIFGDSISDNGNVWRATNKTIPSPKYYFQGRFTNGRVWIEDLDYMLHANLTDLAYGGAVTNNSIYEKVYSFATNSTLNFTDQIPSIDEQVLSLLPNLSNYPPETIYVIWTGSNDLQRIFDFSLNVTNAEIVSSISNSISLLASKGAQRFLIITVPAIQYTPIYNKFTNNNTIFRDLIENYNVLLNGTMSELAQSNSNIIIKVFDSYGGLENIVKDPQGAGFKNVVDYCVNTTNDVGKRGLDNIQTYLLRKDHLEDDKDDCVVPDLVLFGDSLSDNGNIFKATNDTVPPPSFYYNGRFSNGRVWIEDLDYMLHANLTDWAFGGAVTNNTFYEKRIFDYKLNVTHAEVVSTVIKSISLLASKGARNFLVLNVPPIQLTPAYNKFDNRTVIQKLVEGYNLLLNSTLSTLAKSNPNVSINLFDSYGLLETTVKNYKSFGFKNIVDHCLNATSSTGKRGLEDVQNYFREKRDLEEVQNYLREKRASKPKKKTKKPKHKSKKHKNKKDDDDDYVTKEELAFHSPGACENPDEYLYWDNVHPTRKAHRILAAKIEEYICGLKGWKR
ncbi:13548_t:CDS:2 [Acaulospora morrowiae]|uniref:13548_t:CDS:1 n=1 Tax=Acaulospora morrowiae TaxID=94023 RepID=A0A9N8WR51_9GLOM|nr:13548_t:CDS:2 [Acaulospora morrowiae]